MLNAVILCVIFLRDCAYNSVYNNQFLNIVFDILLVIPVFLSASNKLH